MNTLENARKSLSAVYKAQFNEHAHKRQRLIESLTWGQYQKARVQGFFSVALVPKVTKSKRLNLLAADLVYLEEQLKSTGAELDEVLNELSK